MPRKKPKGLIDKEQIKKIFVPHPGKQVEFLASTVDEVFYGGARGGGKSFVLAGDAALKPRKWHYEEVNGVKVFKVDRISIDYPEYRALLIRRTYQDIVNNFKPITDGIYKEFGGTWVERQKAYVFKSGAKIHLVHCDTYADVQKYIGGNYHYLGIEEVNQFPERWIRELGGSVRSTNISLKPFKRYTSNPGGIGHLWLKRRFIDTCPPILGKLVENKRYDIEYREQITNKPYKDSAGNTRLYIPATVFDNPSLYKGDPQYVNYLKSLDDVTKAMWLYGDWSIQSGQFFSEWDANIHVIPEKEFYLDKETMRIYRAMDYGTSNPFVCLFIAVDRNGNCTVFDEVVEAGVSVTPQTKMIHKKMEKLGLTEDNIYATIADPAYWIKNLELGEVSVSPAQIYMDNDILGMIRGINDRIPGAALMRDYLRKVDDDNMQPLRFTQNCKTTIETIPELIHKDTNVEDVDTRGDDHTYDALRYFIMHIGRPHIKKESAKKGWRDRVLGVFNRGKTPSNWVH